MSGSINPLKINDTATLLYRVNKVLRKRGLATESRLNFVNGKNWSELFEYAGEKQWDPAIIDYLTQACERYRELYKEETK